MNEFEARISGLSLETRKKPRHTETHTHKVTYGVGSESDLGHFLKGRMCTEFVIFSQKCSDLVSVSLTLMFCLQI